MPDKTFLFLGLNAGFRTEIEKNQIPEVGNCVNIKNAHILRDGEYQITKLGEIEFLGIKYTSIFIERIGDFKTYLLTLDFSKYPVPGY